MKLYMKFSEEELIQILSESNSYDEALSKLGYTVNVSNRKIIKEISTIYDISIAHFISKQTNNLLGKTFNRLTVIKRVESKRNCARWLCQCKCGNTVEVDANHLTSGRTQSCGCLHKENITTYNKTIKLQDLTGQRFGKLVVLKRADNVGEQPAWICQCDCGVITHPIIGFNLKRGTTKSCGCLVSQGEYKIRQIFQENKIKFKTQITFPECKDQSLLKFDFGVYDEQDELQYLIEYQGVQHYSEVEWTHDSLKDRQRRDSIKQKYCEDNNIPLIIIPYTKFKTLELKDLVL